MDSAVFYSIFAAIFLLILYQILEVNKPVVFSKFKIIN